MNSPCLSAYIQYLGRFSNYIISCSDAIEAELVEYVLLVGVFRLMGKLSRHRYGIRQDKRDIVPSPAR